MPESNIQSALTPRHLAAVEDKENNPPHTDPLLMSPDMNPLVSRKIEIGQEIENRFLDGGINKDDGDPVIGNMTMISNQENVIFDSKTTFITSGSWPNVGLIPVTNTQNVLPMDELQMVPFNSVMNDGMQSFKQNNGEWKFDIEMPITSLRYDPTLVFPRGLNPYAFEFFPLNSYIHCCSTKKAFEKCVNDFLAIQDEPPKPEDSRDDEVPHYDLGAKKGMNWDAESSGNDSSGDETTKNESSGDESNGRLLTPSQAASVLQHQRTHSGTEQMEDRKRREKRLQRRRCLSRSKTVLSPPTEQQGGACGSDHETRTADRRNDIRRADLASSHPQARPVQNQQRKKKALQKERLQAKERHLVRQVSKKTRLVQRLSGETGQDSTCSSAHAEAGSAQENVEVDIQKHTDELASSRTPNSDSAEGCRQFKIDEFKKTDLYKIMIEAWDLKLADRIEDAETKMDLHRRAWKRYFNSWRKALGHEFKLKFDCKVDYAAWISIHGVKTEEASTLSDKIAFFV